MAPACAKVMALPATTNAATAPTLFASLIPRRLPANQAGVAPRTGAWIQVSRTAAPALTAIASASPMSMAIRRAWMRRIFRIHRRARVVTQLRTATPDLSVLLRVSGAKAASMRIACRPVTLSRSCERQAGQTRLLPAGVIRAASGRSASKSYADTRRGVAGRPPPSHDVTSGLPGKAGDLLSGVPNAGARNPRRSRHRNLRSRRNHPRCRCRNR